MEPGAEGDDHAALGDLLADVLGNKAPSTKPTMAPRPARVPMRETATCARPSGMLGEIQDSPGRVISRFALAVVRGVGRPRSALVREASYHIFTPF